ncbi:MAG: O-antigen ligase family protein [Armatimonadetes bacterium]|nr:O-antigen ligase family protein [Armatimonadota bacterium]
MPKPRRTAPPAPEPAAAPLVKPAVALPELLLFAVAAALPFLGRGIVLDSPVQVGVPWGRLILAIGALLVVMLRPTPLRRSAAVWPLTALLVLGAVSLLPRAAGSVVTPFGQRLPLAYPADLEYGVAELTRLGLLLLLCQAALRVRRSVVLAGLVTGATLIALTALREYLPNLRAGDAGWRVFAGFGNPNQFAAFLVVSAPLCLAGAAWLGEDSAPVRWLEANQVRSASAKLRLLGALGALLVLAALGLTGSKGGFLAVMAGAVTATVALARGGRRKAALGALAVIVLVAALALLGPLRARFLALATQSHSQQFRMLVWGGSLDMIRAHPLLGCGLGGWALAYAQFAHSGYTQHAHSDWLGIGAEVGVAGVLALAALYAVMLRDARRQVADGGQVALGVAALASVIGVALAGLVDTGWSVTAVGGALVLLAAATAPAVTAAPRRSKGWLAGLALALLLAAMSLSETARAAGQAAHAGGAPGTAESAYQTAMTWQPWAALAMEDWASLLASMDRRDEARAAYRQVIARRPTSARPHYRLAACEARWGRLDEAVTQSALAVALSPLHLQGRLQLGQLLEKADRPADALGVYRELDRLAQTPALAVKALTYQLDTVHAEALLRIAALDTDAGRIADARRRALPDIEAWLANYDDNLKIMASLSADERQALMSEKGLTEAEHEKVLRLKDEAQR